MQIDALKEYNKQRSLEDILLARSPIFAIVLLEETPAPSFKFSGHGPGMTADERPIWTFLPNL